MFSGIVETIGIVQSLELINECFKLKIQPELTYRDIKIGDSISVNGVCLTVIEHDGHGVFTVSVVPQTLRVTSLGQLKLGNKVNLERSLKINDRCGGHYVQGHIDCTGTIVEIKNEGKEALLVKISIPIAFKKYVVDKGYVAVDGMSLTVIEANNDFFTITLVPHTQKITIAKNYKLGSQVNIEVDILSKYVEKLLGNKNVLAS